MAKIRDLREHTEEADTRPCSVQPEAERPGDAAHLREGLAGFLAAAADGSLRLHLPQTLSAPVARGEGHFHLSPELFLQLEGWTDFTFPGQQLRLKAGEALVVPPQLRHDEWVGAKRGEAFANIVAFAEGPRVSCHLAREIEPGRPGVAHLQAGDHPKAARIHDLLFDACSAGGAGTPWAPAQGRALVAAAVAGLLDVLAAPPDDAPAEPALVTRLRVLIQNQLGDQALSVARLAEQSGCSPDHLSQVFRQSSGENLLACINRLRIERAARLLRETSLAGKEVAWACGFSAHNYFIRVFRQHHGVTPQQWREVAAG
ncbi:AraC family transcriptional regulator [Pelomonas sp. KK5]|uniref:AraC family transcriptional regulator n=1 Tax=Pelomonas sp. KK5 TaxID=1855730 RepID=UPI0018E9C2EB|nr:AraC family transcriptional regulator [Pelomonas sp. KK5]